MAVRRVAPVAPALSLALTLALSLLAVSGCGGDPVKPPPFTPSPSALESSSPTASASPTGPVEPTLPPEAAGESDAAARAFAVYYFELVTYAMRTGDTELADAVAAERCETCASVLTNIHEIYDPGGRLETKGWIVERLRPISSDPSGPRTFYVRMNQSATRLFNEDGRFIDREPPEIVPMLLRLAPVADGWRVQRLDVIT